MVGATAIDFDVVDRGRRAVEAGVRRERRLQARLALLAFEAFEQRRLLAADVGAGAVMDVALEIPAVDVVLADQLGGIGFVDRGLEALAFADEFAAHVDVAGVRPHRERGDEAAFDQQVRIVPHDLAVLARAGLGFVGVDDEIGRARIVLRHERPLEAGRKASATAPAQTRRFHLVDDAVLAEVDQLLGVVPGAAGARTGKPPVVEAVDVGEDAVLVSEHRFPISWRMDGAGRGRQPRDFGPENLEPF